jgi:hypothetical protein
MSNFKHGMRNTGTYKSWRAMIDRCTRPKEKDKKNYLERGITVCDRWRTFENFFADMGERPKGLSIDRIDNDKGYAPGNCRWATRREQDLNLRKTVYLTYKGVTKPLVQWAKEVGIKAETLKSRIRRGAMSTEEAIECPVRYCYRYPVKRKVNKKTQPTSAPR